jgi:hypothetical protein
VVKNNKMNEVVYMDDLFDEPFVGDDVEYAEDTKVTDAPENDVSPEEQYENYDPFDVDFPMDEFYAPEFEPDPEWLDSSTWTRKQRVCDKDYLYDHENGKRYMFYTKAKDCPASCDECIKKRAELASEYTSCPHRKILRIEREFAHSTEMDPDDSTKQKIIAYSRFIVVENYDEIYRLILLADDGVYSIHEVIHGNAPHRFYMDIDAKGLGLHKLPELISCINAAIRAVPLFDMPAVVGPDFKLEIEFLTASSDSKVSVHAITNVVCANNSVSKYIAQEVFRLIRPEYQNYIDILYKSVQSLRIPFVPKSHLVAADSGVMRIFREYDPLDTDVYRKIVRITNAEYHTQMLRRTMVQMDIDPDAVKYGKKLLIVRLPGTIEAVTTKEIAKSMHKKTKEILDRVVKAEKNMMSKLSQTYAPSEMNKRAYPGQIPYSIHDSLEGGLNPSKSKFITLIRELPSFCAVCDRWHDSENLFVVWRPSGDLTLGCFRQEKGGKTCDIGRVIRPEAEIAKKNEKERLEKEKQEAAKQLAIKLASAGTKPLSMHVFSPKKPIVANTPTPLCERKKRSGLAVLCKNNRIDDTDYPTSDSDDREPLTDDDA